MRRGIATQTNRFNLFDPDDGSMFLGIATVQMPAFEVATSEFSGAGVGGVINVPAHGVMNAMTASISVPLIYGEAVRFFELGAVKKIDLQRDIVVINPVTKSAENVSDRWILQGPVTKSDPGKAEQKSAGDASIEMQVQYALHWIDGDEVLEWDPYVPIHTVNGKDLLAEMKSNIGL